MKITIKYVHITHSCQIRSLFKLFKAFCREFICCSDNCFRLNTCYHNVYLNMSYLDPIVYIVDIQLVDEPA